MSYIQALFTPIRDITEKFNLFVAAMASCEKIFEFMDRPIESGIKIATQIHSENNFKGKLEFKNIDFEYTKDQKILKNINLKIEAGEKIGIVGHTGAGKTTLSALLMRFYDPTNGEILFDDKNILDFDKRTIRDKIGYIQQDPFLFSGSIADNIFLWDEKRKEVFDSLPLKVREPFLDGRLNLEQAVYEKGTNLSIGERQMVAFLRAIVKDPSILILDEATAHIDLLTEQWIEQVSDLVFKDKTVLIIAHRLSTLKRVNRILVFHRGELQEQGSHLDLISKNGIYQKLYHIQIKREQLLMQ